jgi:hypothetical protein
MTAAGLAPTYADVYRWVDDHGEAHYTDRWVPGSVLIKTTKPHPPTETVGSHRSTTEKDILAAGERATEKLKDEANTRATQQDVAKTREQQCKQAKDRYQQAIEARRLYKPA